MIYRTFLYAFTLYAAFMAGRASSNPRPNGGGGTPPPFRRRLEQPERLKTPA